MTFLRTSFLLALLSIALGNGNIAAAQSGDTSSTTTTETTRSADRGISPGGLYVEPLLFASRTDSSIKTSQLPIITDDTSGRLEGYGIGAKFGIHASEILLLGVDGRYANTRFSDSSYESANATQYNYGPSLGLQTPLFGLRILGTYVMGGELNPTAGAQGVDLKFRNPRGWRVGAGLHIAALSVNLEYEDLKYNDTDIEALGPINTDINSEIDASSTGYTLSVGFPVEL